MNRMTRRVFGALILMAWVGWTAACAGHYGHRYYPDVPRFAPTHPAQVELLRREPRRAHLQIGEVWIRPEPDMSRGYVEDRLRYEAARMGADALVMVVDRFFRERVWDRGYGRGRYAERQIVGIAIRYRRR